MTSRTPLWIPVVVWVVALIWIIPVVGIIATSLRPPTEIALGWWRLDDGFSLTLDAWVKVFTTYPIAGAFWVTLQAAGISTILTVVMTAMGAYAFHYLRFPLRRTLLIVIINAFVLPAQITIIPLFLLWRDVGLLDTIWAVIIPYVGASFAWSIFLVKNFLEDFPREMIEASKIDGCGPLSTFFYIVLPNLITPLSAVSILQFLWCWNSLLLPVVFLRSNIPLPQLLTRVSGTYESNFDQRAVAAIITTIVPLVVFLIFQRQFTAGSLNRSGAKE
jgi:ABC-type glycerol-3-phosphate transport system permease component